MVIHDLKYPTESIIETVKQIMRQLQCTQTQLTSVQAENENLKKNLKNLLRNISSTNQSSVNGSLPNFIENEDAPKSD
jgi:peptidoglycan hydrolase CwlO-like protein